MFMRSVLFAVSISDKQALINFDQILNILSEEEKEENKEIIAQCFSDQLFIQETEEGEFGGTLDEALEEAKDRLFQNAFLLYLTVKERLEDIVEQGEFVQPEDFIKILDEQIAKTQEAKIKSLGQAITLH